MSVWYGCIWQHCIVIFIGSALFATYAAIVMKWKGASKLVKEIQIKLHLKNSWEAVEFECMGNKKDVKEAAACIVGNFTPILISFPFISSLLRKWTGEYDAMTMDGMDNTMMMMIKCNYPECIITLNVMANGQQQQIESLAIGIFL